MARAVREFAANPGRGSHQMAMRASRTLFETRKHIAQLFNIKNENDISFALNTTHALNQAILGFLRPGDHAITTGIEHNSVRRPLEYLRKTRNVAVTYVPADSKGRIDLRELEQAIGRQTALIVCTHSSNLTGSILPIMEISAIAKKHGVKILVDAAQSAGVLPIDVERMGIDMLAFPGHKGLLGPQGTGGLYVHPDLQLEPVIFGGTGSQSEQTEQPTVRPDRYEPGTQNTPGIAGLNEGVKFVLRKKVEHIHRKEWEQTQRLMEGLLQINGIEILGPGLGEEKTGIVSFRLKGIDPSELAFILDRDYHIAVRSGYHCAPLAHQSAGTLDFGAVRASVGVFTTDEDVEYFIAAVKEINRCRIGGI
jgi:cysteine desulfurase family protein